MRVQTALVREGRDGAEGVLTDLLIRVVDASGARVAYEGTVRFTPRLQEHVVRELLPTVDRILAFLNIAPAHYVVSAVNAAEAAVHDLALEVDGYSADLSLLIGFLGAATGIAPRCDVVVTGHLSSPEGDIAPVGGVAAKLRAATSGVVAFGYPALTRKNEPEAVVAARQSRLKVCELADLSDAIELGFAEDAIVLAGVAREYPDVSTETVLEHCAWKLGGNLWDRAWSTLRRQALEGISPNALLHQLARRGIVQDRYPAGLGGQLADILQTLPPATKRLQFSYPLLDAETLAALGKTAELDPADFLTLKRLTGMPDASGTMDADRTASLIFETLSDVSIVRECDAALDQARAEYALQRPANLDRKALSDLLLAFYRHLMAALPVESRPQNEDALGALLELLDRRWEGGFLQVLQTVQSGLNGGLRGVLDALTEELKYERRQAYIGWILANAIDATSWEERVALVSALLKRFPELENLPAARVPVEELAADHERIVPAIAQCLSASGRTLSKL